MKIQLKLKLAIILVSISLLTSILYGVDKFTSTNPADAASIRIGLSDKDSSSCQECLKNGVFFNSGCKKCEQDGVVFIASVGKDRFYNLGWSDNDGMYHGNESCSGITNFEKIESSKNDTFWIEITKNNLELSSIIYSDANFSTIVDSTSINLCSNPTDLKFIRISNEDGKPSSNGGLIAGHIDDFKIITTENSKNSPELIFSTTFDECKNKSCNDTWTLQNSKNNFINIDDNVFQYLSTISGINDYAHMEVNTKIPDNSWILQFKFHISELVPHPMGKGVLNIEPEIRKLVFALPSLVFPFISLIIAKNEKSSLLGMLIIVSGIAIISGFLYSSFVSIENNETFDSYRIIQLSITIITGILILLLGMRKIKNLGVIEKK